MSRRTRILALFVLLLALSVAALVNRLHISSDISMFLPQGASWPQRVLVEELRKGANGRLVLIAIEGGQASQRIAVSRQLAQALKQSNRFVYVNNGSGTLPRHERELLYRYRFLLSQNVDAQRFTEVSIRQALEARLADMASVAAPLVKPYLADDPFLDGLAVLRQWGGTRKIARSEGVWVSADNQRALILAYPQAAASELDQQQQIAQFISSRFIEHAADDMSLMLSGPAMIAVDTRNEIRSDTQFLSAVASVIAILFLFLAFRSPRVVILGVLPLFSGALIGLAVTTMVYGQVHGIAVAFGVTLIGIAIDYPMHFFSHAGHGIGGPDAGIQRIWPTLRLGVITTAVGFMALIFGGYGGLTQLGLFSITGLTTAALVTRFVLPVVTPTHFSLAPTLGFFQRGLFRLANAAAKLRYTVVLLLVFSAAGLVYLGDDLWLNDPSRMAPLSNEVRDRDTRLRHDLNAPFVQDLILVSAPEQETLLQRLEQLQSQLQLAVDNRQLGSYDIATRYLPSQMLQRQRLEALPESAQLISLLNSAAKSLPYNPDLFDPFIGSVAQARSLPMLELASFRDTLLGERLAPLMFEFDNRWVASIPIYGEVDSQSMQRLADNAGTDVVYIQTRQETQQMMANYRKRAIQVFAFGALAILVVLVVGLGSVTTAFRVLMVPLSVVLLTMPIIYLLVDGGLGLFHLVALLLVIGLGIDYALFFNRLAANQDEWDSTFPALWKSWLTTVLVFGSLAFSQAVVLQAIGLTVSVGVSLCFLLGAVWMRRGLVMRPYI
jgi:predicted exporter